MTAILPILLLTFLCGASSALPAQGKDRLTAAYTRWMRDFQAGRIDPMDVSGPQKNPYLTPGQRPVRPDVSSVGPRANYTRLLEAEDLFALLKERGTSEDAGRLLRVIEVSLKKKGGQAWEVYGDYSRIRQAAIDVIGRKPVPAAIQAAVLDRIRGGFAESTGRDGTDPATRLSHREPELAAALIPLLGAWAEPSFRSLLEQCVHAADTGMQATAAEALAAMGYGRSLATVARALESTQFSDEIVLLASSLDKLAAAEKPKPTEHDLKLALGIVLERLQKISDWRARIALVPITRHIRSRSSIPVLIDLLEEVGGNLGKSGKAGRPYSGTLLASIHEALVDLCGFYADARAPEKWREWWQSVQADFELPPAKSERAVAKGGTVAQGFFGIPVTGNRVVFVLDMSGSMAWPFQAPTAASAGLPAGKYESRIERAKKELMSALEAMQPDCQFNVVFFSDHVKVWKDSLVWANAKSKKAIADDLDRINASGATMLFDGLEAASKTRFKGGTRDDPYGSPVDEIFVLTDGSPTAGTITNTQDILDHVRRWNRTAQVRIHAIYIGDDKIDELYAPPNSISRLPGNMKGEEFMRHLAEENWGKFSLPVGK